MSNGNGHHWSKFCWRDWTGDPALRDCSLAAKGFWIGILGLMHEGTPVGHLTISGRPATTRQMASHVNCTEREAKKALAELEAAGVFSRTDDGTIYSRRMVRDTESTEAAKAWGKTGGNPSLKAKPNGHGTDPPPPRGVNPPLKAGGYPPPKPTPLTHPITGRVNGGVRLEVESQVQLEEEKKVSVFKNLTLTSPVLARVVAACETAPPGTLGAEPEQTSAETEPTRAEKAMQIATKTVVGKLVRKLESTGMRPAVKYPAHSVKEQIVASVTRPELKIPKGLEAHILEQRQALMRRAIERVRLVA